MTVAPARSLGPTESAALAELLLTLADDEFILGFWDSEWTGIAPILEEDVAMSSISQDEIGHARAWYELLAQLTADDADRIAFGRAPDEYRHAALLNHARGDWAHTVARRLLYETADAVRLESLTGSSYAPVAELAAKMRREETYHLLHWNAWLRQLTAAGGEARDRLVAALALRWSDAQSIFAPLAGEGILRAGGILPEAMAALQKRWHERLGQWLSAAGLSLPGPATDPPQPSTAGRTGRTPDFAWLHSEFTLVARSEEGATW
ncbi:MAG TPA: 1,2-phenylacetyl-CoA epoxidase subunit PaaC [Candidatus Limnocylindria bacterium]|nr:1,2-phenylacetyl-CoA epoxidase subunit PaaC [Candidatus Limnocylindria bacterium]